MLPYVVGIALSIGVALFARLVRLDRDRAFYATVTIVVASYYGLFAVMGESPRALALESIVMAGFTSPPSPAFRFSMPAGNISAPSRRRARHPMWRSPGRTRGRCTSPDKALCTA